MPSTLRTAAVCTAAGLAAGAWFYASAYPASQLFGPTLIAGDDPNQIALTFDDGPNPTATPHLLDVLARHGVHATFFAIGSYVRQQPALARRILAEGHLLCNHTMLHPHLAFQSAARMRQELRDCTAALEDVTGTSIRYFRPPFGSRRPAVLRIARELNLTPVLWNVAAFDWNPIGPDRILANLQTGIVRNVRRQHSSNLLLHDGSHRAPDAHRQDTVTAVDRLLIEHRATQTSFVTLDAWSRPRPPLIA